MDDSFDNRRDGEYVLRFYHFSDLILKISNAIRAELISSGILEDNAYVVVAGPANTYAHYVATLEEYGEQRYEGASTIFGQCKNFISFVPRPDDSTNCWLIMQIHWMRT